MPADRVVFWDIDGTIIAPSLERLFIKYLNDRRLVTAPRFAGRLLRLGLRLPVPPWYRVKVAYLRNESVEKVAGWVDVFWNEIVEVRLHPGAIETLTLLRERGAIQVLLSGTLEPLARRLADLAGVEHVIAGRPEIRDDKYTGALITPHPHGMYKVRYAEDWLRNHGGEWSTTAAVADHFGDRFLLERVHRAVAVKAHPELVREAERRGWCIAAPQDLPTLADYLLES